MSPSRSLPFWSVCPGNRPQLEPEWVALSPPCLWWGSRSTWSRTSHSPPPSSRRLDGRNLSLSPSDSAPDVSSVPPFSRKVWDNLRGDVRTVEESTQEFSFRHHDKKSAWVRTPLLSAHILTHCTMCTMCTAHPFCVWFGVSHSRCFWVRLFWLLATEWHDWKKEIPFTYLSLRIIIFTAALL